MRLSADGHLSCFYILTIMYNTGINSDIQAFAGVYIFNNLHMHFNLRGELMDYMITLFNFWNNGQIV